MRYIGLDLGTKTLGVAVSDKTETIASAITTLRFSENNPEEVLDDLTKIMDEYKVGAIVIGLPKNMNNSLGFAAERTKEFVKVLNNTYDIPVYEQDERLSSVTANNVLLQADISRKKKKVQSGYGSSNCNFAKLFRYKKGRKKWKITELNKIIRLR